MPSTVEKGTSGAAQGWAGRPTLWGPRPKEGESGATLGGRWRGSRGSRRDPLEFPTLSPPGIEHLDLVASFIKNQTNNLMVNSLRGRS